LACKPDSVSLRGLSDHLSRGPVTRSFVQSTRRLLPCRRECGPHSSHWLFLLLDFAPDGGCLAAPVTPRAGGLLHHLFTLATRALSLSGSRSVSVALSTGHPARALPGIAPYGVRTFLTPEMQYISRPRPPGHLRLKTKCLPISYRISALRQCWVCSQGYRIWREMTRCRLSRAGRLSHQLCNVPMRGIMCPRAYAAGASDLSRQRPVQQLDA